MSILLADVLLYCCRKQHAVPLASMGIENKVIPYSILCSERVFFWRALAEYLKPTDDNLEEESVKHFDNVLPELTPFTQYIQQYVLTIYLCLLVLYKNAKFVFNKRFC